MNVTKKKINILIVDDDEKIRELLQAVFSDMEYTCDTACDGQAGFKKTVNASYDLIILDLNMPLMNGVDCLKAIRQVDPLIPIIVITGFQDIVEENKQTLSLANSIINKPFKIEAFINAVQSLIRIKK
ncbi:MAG: response regulator receiver protein [uncultured bacterium]|nr:MAG: response regulator receiver protein [uncultured bacterium]